jgi:hypothetical protein
LRLLHRYVTACTGDPNRQQNRTKPTRKIKLIYVTDTLVAVSSYEVSYQDVQLSAVLTQRPVSPAAETYEHDVDIVKRALNGLLFAVFGREVSFPEKG